MYDYLDRPIGSLDEGSRFFIWSVRGWVQSLSERRCPPSVLGPTFARSDLSDALPHFHMAMMALNRDGIGRLGFGSLGCPHVSEAEAVLLSLVRLLGTGRSQAAAAAIPMLVREEAVTILNRALTTVAILFLARYPLPTPGAGLHNGVDGQ
ncbi:MAG: hypothetical protein ABW184_00050 [Sphingobium sp.]